jgi:site-specific recombinase XerD
MPKAARTAKRSAAETHKTAFLEHLEIERGASQKTIRNYDFYLSRFFNEMKVTAPEEITADAVRRFRLMLGRRASPKGGVLTPATINYHLIALRAFLKYLARQDVPALPPEKIELAKQTQHEVSFLTPDEVEQLLAAPLDAEAPETIRIRDKAILETLFSTGLRVAELAALTVDQVSISKDEFTVRGKGGKLRLVFLSEDARHWLKEYLAKRNSASLSLFVRHDRAGGKGGGEGAALTPRSIQRLVAHYAKTAGITKPVTPHTLRHSYATDLLGSGADIRSVQALLGHASITTTQIYTHVTNRQLKAVYKTHHHRRRGKTRG